MQHLEAPVVDDSLRGVQPVTEGHVEDRVGLGTLVDVEQAPQGSRASSALGLVRIRVMTFFRSSM